MMAHPFLLLLLVAGLAAVHVANAELHDTLDKSVGAPHLEGHIEIANQTQFDEIINYDASLIMFKASWCDHCTAAFPDFEHAANALKDSENIHNKVAMASIECTVDVVLKEICASQELGGYPTFFIYRKGQRTEPPHLRRDFSWYLGYIRRFGGNYLMELPFKSISDLDNSLDGQNPSVVFYVKDFANRMHLLSHTIASHVIGVCDVFATNDPSFFGSEAKSQLEVATEGVAMFHKGSPPVIYDGDWDLERVVSFLRHEMYPLVGSITTQSYFRYISDPKYMLVILFVIEEKQAEEYKSVLNQQARLRREYMHFAIANASVHWSYGVRLGLSGAWPAAIAHNFTDRKRYVIEKPELSSPTMFTKFIELVTSGQHPHFMHSQPAPSISKEAGSHIHTVVLNTFEPMVVNSLHDVLLVYHESHSMESSQVLRVLEEIAEALSKTTQNIMIGKYDAELNEIPDSANTHITHLPLVQFYTSTTKQPITFNEEHNVYEYLRFLRRHTKFKEDLTDLAVVVEGKDGKSDEIIEIHHSEL